MDIYILHLPKSDLEAMPKAERTLILLLGHASNEINVLQRFMLLSINSQFSDKSGGQVTSGQTLILFRLLAGKLNEAWELFRKRVLSNKAVADRILPKLRVEGEQTLAEVKSFFGKKNVINQIRNEYAFHNPSDDAIEESFQATKSGEPLRFYLTENVGNSFYHASELIVMQAILKRMGVIDPDLKTFEAQFVEMMKMTGRIARAYTILFSEVIGVLVAPNFPMPDKEILTPEPPPLSSLKIPFFIEFGK